MDVNLKKTIDNLPVFQHAPFFNSDVDLLVFAVVKEIQGPCKGKDGFYNIERFLHLIGKNPKKNQLYATLDAQVMIDGKSYGIPSTGRIVDLNESSVSLIGYDESPLDKYTPLGFEANFESIGEESSQVNDKEVYPCKGRLH